MLHYTRQTPLISGFYKAHQNKQLQAESLTKHKQAAQFLCLPDPQSQLLDLQIKENLSLKIDSSQTTMSATNIY
jgi:hypothetical protein